MLLMVPAVWAQQQNLPHIGYVYPAGGRQGATFEVVVGGQNLNGVTNVVVTGPGVQAVVLNQKRTLTPKEAKELREEMEALQAKKKQSTEKPPSGKAARQQQLSATNAVLYVVFTPEDEKRLVEIRQKLSRFVRRPANPAIAESVVVQVTLAPNAAIGDREVRLVSERGMSNPLTFMIGQLPEFTKPEAKPETEERARPETRSAVAPTEMNITLPAVVNGQILPGGVDRYRFAAHRGQQLIVTASARQLIPYLADAVPGWFQATLAIFDAKGHELDYADHYRFQPDPVLYCAIPKDGEYVVEIHDSIYRGREDFVYRLTFGSPPFITGIFPLGVQAGQQVNVALRGFNLSASSLTFDAQDKAPGSYPIIVRNEEWISNVMPFVVDDLPECLAAESNNTPATAQSVTLPVIINGRIDSPGRTSVFQFEGHTGQKIVAEVRARRLNSPLDSVLKLTDANGKLLAFNDDFDDKGAGLITHQADSYLSTNLPANGVYYLHLADTQHKGGPDYAYRLRISAPRPDFELRVTPASLNARPGGSVPVTVFILRRDGFTNAVSLSLKNPPAGFSLTGANRITTQDQIKLTLDVPRRPQTEPYSLYFEGRTKVQDQEIVHDALPAEDMMQAFIYRHLVPTKELKVSVATPPRPKPQPRLLTPTPVEVPAGGAMQVRIAIPGGIPSGQLRCEIVEAPDGVTVQSFMLIREGLEIVLQSDRSKVKVGQKGRVIIQVLVDKKPLETIPAIPIEISPP